MLASQQSEKRPNGAESVPNAVLVREQLRRLLAHPLFTNSKRYPVLLAHTVEQALDGNASELKERTIGVEAFGREPDYDVNLDPVVRMTASEVRKRLSQYYYNSDHAGELIIELPVGSYVPCFRGPASHPIGSAATQAAEHIEASSRESLAPSVPQAESQRATSRLKLHHWIAFAIALLFAAFVGFNVGRIKLPVQPTDLERFWNPITATSNRVTYCLAEPFESVDRKSRTADSLPEYASLNVSDVTTLARAIVHLVTQNGAFRVVGSSHTSFAQLREGPVVLIGAFDNPWTMRITQDLPIGFEYDNQFRKIVDRKSSPKRLWTIRGDLPDTKLAQDYAVVARIHDNVTGQPVIILAGIWGEGTEAASEVVSNPVYMNALLEKLPKEWDRLNLEAVIETRLIDGHPSPPTIVAVETW